MSEQWESNHVSHRFRAKQSRTWGCIAGVGDGHTRKECPFEGLWCHRYPKPIT